MCKWYGCLAGSGPQTQWLASTRRQWVTLLILDRRQVGAGVRSDGEAEVIVYNLGEIKCCHHFFLPLSHRAVTAKSQLCQQPNRTAQNGSSLSEKSWTVGQKRRRQRRALTNTKALPCYQICGATELTFPAHLFFTFALFHFSFSKFIIFCICTLNQERIANAVLSAQCHQGFRPYSAFSWVDNINYVCVWMVCVRDVTTVHSSTKADKYFKHHLNLKLVPQHG